MKAGNTKTIIYSIAVLFLVCCHSIASSNNFLPDYSKATLQYQGKIINVDKIDNTATSNVIRSADIDVCFSSNSISAVALGGDTNLWSHKASKGIRFGCLSFDSDTLYVREWGKAKKHAGYVVRDPYTIKRISLKNGDWLAPIKLPKIADETGESSPDLIGFLSLSDSVVVLLNNRIDHDEEESSAILQVFSFHRDSGKLMWKSEQDLDIYGWTYHCDQIIPEEVYEPEEILTLQAHNGVLVVCAHDQADITALDLRTGKEIWRLERIWEFQRGFIGPSVWSYFIARCGNDDYEDLMDKSAFDAIEDKEYKTELTHERNEIIQTKSNLLAACSISGGPILLPRNKEFTLFVAVDMSLDPSYAGAYLTESIMYEVSSSGQIESMVKMPRNVTASEYKVLNDGVIWMCSTGIAKLAPSSKGTGGGSLLGGMFEPDPVLRLEWYREPILDSCINENNQEEQGIWLTTGSADVSPVILKDYLWCVPDGGFIESKSDKVFHFPISTVSFHDGTTTRLTLSIPFQGIVKEPDSNYSSWHNVNEPENKYISAYGPHYLAITKLEEEGQTLKITLLSDKCKGSVLTFKLPEHK